MWGFLPPSVAKNLSAYNNILIKIVAKIIITPHTIWHEHLYGMNPQKHSYHMNPHIIWHEPSYHMIQPSYLNPLHRWGDPHTLWDDPSYHMRWTLIRYEPTEALIPDHKWSHTRWTLISYEMTPHIIQNLKTLIIFSFTTTYF